MTMNSFLVDRSGNRENAVRIEFSDGPNRRTAILKWTALEGAFDDLLKLSPPNRRLHPHEWDILAIENLSALSRIISRKYEQTIASTGKPAPQIEVNLLDIRNSGETLTRASLPIKTGNEWSREDLHYLAYELRRNTPLLQIAECLQRDVVEVETMADRIENVTSLA